MFVAEADDSFLKEKGYKPYDKQVRHVYFGMGELPEELKTFESSIEDCGHVTIMIPRVKDESGKIFRLLPAFLMPYKRYSIDDIENELDPEALPQTTASDKARRGWQIWWKAFKKNVSDCIESSARKLKGWLSRLILLLYGSFPPTLRGAPA